MYFKVKSVGSSFSLTMLEKKLNDEVTGIKKGGGVYLSASFYQFN